MKKAPSPGRLGRHDRNSAEAGQLQDIIRGLSTTLFGWKNTPGWPVVYVSDDVARFGYTPEDFHAGRMTMTSLIHPDDLKRIRKETAAHLKAKHALYRQEYRILTRGGETRWIEGHTRATRSDSGRITSFHGALLDLTSLRVFQQKAREYEIRHGVLAETSPDETTLLPVRDGDGPVQSVMGISRDVSERRLLQQEIRDSEAKYRALFENSMAGMLVYDLVCDEKGIVSDAIIADANRTAVAITGLALKQLVGKRITDFGKKTPRQLCAFFTSVSNSGTPVAFDLSSDYLKKHFSCFAFPAWKNRIAMMFIDVTSRKRIEAQMEDYRKQLLRLAAENAMTEERERRRIAVDLHDGVGQSLVLCKMHIEEVFAVAESPVEKARLTSAIQAIEAAIHDTRSLTFRLSPPVLHELGLVAALQWLAEDLETNHGLPIRVIADSASEPEDTTVRIMLFQGARELLMNVLKHARASSVSIRLSGSKDTVLCSVKDNGKGFTLHPRRSGSPQHDGMGLFNIRERLQLIGGSMKISGRAGRGTTVELVAPRKLQVGALPPGKDRYEETADRVV